MMDVPLPANSNRLADKQIFRDAVPGDLSALVTLEKKCFSCDRLSPRQFKHWIKANNKVLLVVEDETQQLLAYGLVILRKGTRLARLYSIAVDKAARGKRLGRSLMEALETRTLAFNRLFMRLEVAQNNTSAINLYQSMGYKTFGISRDYYEDHTDALRMQKAIKQLIASQVLPAYPWYQQTTDFTCGPASLMMVMAHLKCDENLSQQLELDLWREATTIFMTSGHGGCHPFGLALAAQKRGLQSEIFINQSPPLFATGVRNPHKKQVLEMVESQFQERVIAAGIRVHHQAIDFAQLENALKTEGSVLMLISTYQLDGKKVPHWVTVTATDQDCIYLHDPDLDPEKEQPLDCQHIPIAIQDFAKLSCYGKDRLRAAIVLFK